MKNTSDPPKCTMVECDNIISKKTDSQWHKYCCAECRKVGTSVGVVAQSRRDPTPPKCKVVNCNNIISKKKNGEWIKYCCLDCKKIGVALQIRDTMQERHGVVNTLQLEVTKEKSKNTIKQTYGVDHVMHSDIFKDKLIATNLERFGYPSVLQSESVKDKIKITNMERYGYTNVGESQLIKDRIVERNMEKYGCHPSQLPEVHEKKMKSGYRCKEYTFPSGRIVKIRGYEPLAINDLLKIYDENDIIVKTTDIPHIPYVGIYNKNCVYFPDIYIPKANLIVEVKSDFTYYADYEINMLKAKATKHAGYDYTFMIYNDRFQRRWDIIPAI